mmetsp:Transcript_6285/g.15619  ORF Transcript_6285/g.15619 Transcript_6285/m.15619 type:complete len:494 (+) Transcript_6285:61-1542(+)
MADESAWAHAIKSRGVAHGFEIWMERQGINDEKMRKWCEWFDRRCESLTYGRRGLMARQLNFSHNEVSEIGVRFLLDVLMRREVRVKVLKLYQNRIADGTDLAELVRWSKGQLVELHLSHNRLNTDAACQIVTAAVAAVDTRGVPCYPQGGIVPLWLRLELNCVEFTALEAQLKPALKELGRPPEESVCHVDSKATCWCRPKCCVRLASPPAVHVTYLRERGSAAERGAAARFARSSRAEPASEPPQEVPSTASWLRPIVENVPTPPPRPASRLSAAEWLDLGAAAAATEIAAATSASEAEPQRASGKSQLRAAAPEFVPSQVLRGERQWVPSVEAGSHSAPSWHKARPQRRVWRRKHPSGEPEHQDSSGDAPKLAPAQQVGKPVLPGEQGRAFTKAREFCSVLKHNAMGCAVVSFQNPQIRDAVLRQANEVEKRSPLSEQCLAHVFDDKLRILGLAELQAEDTLESAVADDSDDESEEVVLFGKEEELLPDG